MTIKNISITDTKKRTMTRNIMSLVFGTILTAVFVVLAVNMTEIRIFASIIAGTGILGILFESIGIYQLAKKNETAKVESLVEDRTAA